MSVPGPDGTPISSCVRDSDGNRICYTNAGRTRLLVKQLGLDEAPPPPPLQAGKDNPMTIDLYDLRRREVQVLGAALSCRNWHMMETAYNSLRDKMDNAGFTVAGPRSTTPTQGLDAATIERRRKALREALDHLDNIAGVMNGDLERDDLTDADDVAMSLAEAYGVSFDRGWPDAVAALATDPHQHGDTRP